MPEATKLVKRWHHFRAWAGGYFWKPCPLCGEMFGGHQISDRTTHVPTGCPGITYVTCPKHDRR